MIEKYFKIILNRLPNRDEINRFSSHTEEQIIQELSICKEKIKLLFSMSGENVKKKFNYSDEDIRDFFTSNKYNVAICLSGHLRDYKRNLHSFNKFIVKPLNADVFIHTWDSTGTQQKIVKSTVGPVPNESVPLNDDYKNYINNLKSIKVENNKEYLDELEKTILNKEYDIYGQLLGNDYFGGQAEPKYIHSQFYSIYQSFKLLEDYSTLNNKKYDIVIKMRADYELSSGIEEKDFEYLINNKNTLFIPSIPYSNHGHPSCCICNQSDVEHHHIEDVCDVFSYSNYENMKHYMSVYRELDNFRKDFIEKNNKLLSSGNYRIEKHKNYRLINIWDNLNYNLNCFYPERIFIHYLKNYILKPSKLSGEVLR